MDTRISALVTGASSGIGAVYADRLARRGYNLVLVARDEGRLRTVAGRISATHRSATIIVADLTNESELARVEHVLRTDASINMLVNNAGIALSGETAAADPTRPEHMIRLNVLAPTRLASAVIPGFLTRKRGTVINIGSAVALAPESVNGAYSGTKAYVLNLSLKLRQELAGTGVRVQLVLPGAIRTPMWEKGGIDRRATAHGPNEEERRDIRGEQTTSASGR